MGSVVRAHTLDTHSSSSNSNNTNTMGVDVNNGRSRTSLSEGMEASTHSSRPQSLERAQQSKKGEEELIEINPALRGIRFVIFPQNRAAQVWDLIMIFNIWYYAFVIPFHFGISSGYYSANFSGWMVFNLITNILFLVDTFLAFFRAYHDDRGNLIFSLRTIRRNYIKSGWFFLNLLASFPAFLSSLIYRATSDGNMEASINDRPTLFLIMEAFKLLRLVRIRSVMRRSELMSCIWEILNVELALLVKFFFMIILMSHWIACMWGLIVYLSAGSFSTESLLDDNNWLSHWYSTSYVEGGLNPLGVDNAMPRYWLCLFWAIQSITSIGYGNIVPVTTMEYGFANLLMMISGVFWAYVIGNLVDAVHSMGSSHQEYVTRMNEANQMMHDFTIKRLPEAVGGPVYAAKCSKRVRRFITQQRDVSTNSWEASSGACKLTDAYPTLSILSPELQQVCALHLSHSLLETIPYLSTKYLTPEEQARVAMQCVTLEFSTAETFTSHPDLGRGVIIFRSGFGCVSRKGMRNYLSWHSDLNDKPIDVNEVLVEDDYYPELHLVFHFVGFARAFFVPRTAIMEVLEKNYDAWKCARWRYFMGGFTLYSLSRSQQSMRRVDYSDTRRLDFGESKKVLDTV